MPIEANNLRRTNNPSDDKLLDYENHKDYDFMREYANQLNGEIDVDESREDG